MTKTTKPAPTAAKAKPAPAASKAPAKKPDTGRLSRLSAQIAGYPSGPDRALIEALVNQEGMKLRMRNGNWLVRMAGLEAEGRDPATALVNWGNRARRAMQGEL